MHMKRCDNDAIFTGRNANRLDLFDLTGIYQSRHEPSPNFLKNLS